MTKPYKTLKNVDDWAMKFELPSSFQLQKPKP